MSVEKDYQKTDQSFLTFISFFLVLNCYSVSAKDLIDVIPSLYGGNGVQLLEATVGFSHAPHFQDDALRELNMLTQSATDIEIPYPHSTSGINFIYDSVLDDFVKTLNDNSLLYTETSKTLGKGIISAAITYSNISFDLLDGKSLNHLSISLDHEDIAGPGSDICIGGPVPTCYLFEDDKIILDVDLELNSEILFLSAGFGLTDKIDVEFILPIIKNRLSISSSAHILENDTKRFFPGTVHEFDAAGVNGDFFKAQAKENKIGFGDLVVRGKWHFYSFETIDLATLVEVLIPTGEKDNFMGSDTFSVTPTLILSTLSGIAGLPINAHINLGYEVSTGDGHNELSYAAAIAYHKEINNSVLSTSFEILGKHRIETRTGFGDDQVDAAVGGKWSFMESHSLFFNYRFPLNDDGLRASNIFSIGYAANY